VSAIKGSKPEFSPVWPYGLLLLLVVVFLWPMFLEGKLPFMRDMFFEFLPQHLFAKKIFWSGHLPFWNPHSGSGKPFIADPQTATFYPLHAVFYVFSAPVALRIYCGAHLWLAGATIFALARHWRMQVIPALVAAVTCMFSSWSIANLEFANNLGAAVWAPLIVLTLSHIERILRTEDVPGRAARLTGLTLVLALLFAVQYLAGFPEFLVYTAALAATYAVAHCAFNRALKPLLETLAIFLAAGLLASLVSAPQLLLSLEFLPLSERAAAINPRLDMASLQLHNLLQFLFPFINGHPGYPNQFWGGSIFEFWIGTCYLGILPLILALFSVFVFHRGRSRRDQKFLCTFLFGTIVFGILMALGKNTPLYQFLYDWVPGFGHFRFPSKFLVLVLFAVSLLAGLGWQEILHVCKWAPYKNRLQLAILVLGLTAIAVFVSGYFFAARGPQFFRFLTNGLFPNSDAASHRELNDYLVAIIALVMSVGAILIGTMAPMRRTTWIAPVLIFANLFFVTRDLHHMVDQSVYETRSANLPRALPDLANWRIHSVYGPVQQWLYGSRDDELIKWAASAGVGDSWLPFGINQSWQGGQKLSRYFALYYLLWSLPPDKALKLADLLSIRYTLAGAPFDQISWDGAPKGLQLVEHPNARPRAFLVGNWILSERVDDPNRATSEILEKLLLPDFDLASSAIVESGSGAAQVENASIPRRNGVSASDAGEVVSLQDDINEVRAHVAVKTKALFVLNDAWYPGWSAFVDGVARPIVRTNFHFRGVFLDPGEHELRFIFAPKQFRIGLWIAFPTIALMSGLFVLINRLTRKS
jgi:hypothetical protein